MSDSTKEKLFIKIFSIILVILVCLGVIYIFLNQQENENQGPTFTMEYLDITPVQAYDLINESKNNDDYNLTVIDCRGLEGCSTCQFNRGHLPGATLNENYKTLYNYTSDILVYSVDGSLGADFCQNLTGFVYGAIYNLQGGYAAWSQHPNFPTE